MTRILLTLAVLVLVFLVARAVFYPGDRASELPSVNAPGIALENEREPDMALEPSPAPPDLTLEAEPTDITVTREEDEDPQAPVTMPEEDQQLDGDIEGEEDRPEIYRAEPPAEPAESDAADEETGDDAPPEQQR